MTTATSGVPERSFTRESILARLRATIAEGRPIVGAGSSVGIVARAAEAGGADLIIVYSTGKTRIWGLPTTPLLHSNPVTLSMYDEIDNVIDDTPIIGGAHAGDPDVPAPFRDLSRRFATSKTSTASSTSRPLALIPSVLECREHVGQGSRARSRDDPHR